VISIIPGSGSLSGRSDCSLFELIGWSTVIGRTGSEEEKGRLGTKEAWAQEEKEKAEKAARGEKEDEDQGTPPGGNARLREDSLGKGDVIMARSTEGRDYSSKSGIMGFLNFSQWKTDKNNENWLFWSWRRITNGKASGKCSSKTD
jgi:hypothetical protein